LPAGMFITEVICDQVKYRTKFTVIN